MLQAIKDEIDRRAAEVCRSNSSNHTISKSKTDNEESKEEEV